MPATARPTVTIYNAADGTTTGRQVALPAVMVAPVRPDIVGFVHTEMAKNKRQAYSVKVCTRCLVVNLSLLLEN